MLVNDLRRATVYSEKQVLEHPLEHSLEFPAYYARTRANPCDYLTHGQSGSSDNAIVITLAADSAMVISVKWLRSRSRLG